MRQGRFLTRLTTLSSVLPVAAGGLALSAGAQASFGAGEVVDGSSAFDREIMPQGKDT